MGGYDSILFKCDEEIPKTTKEFWSECKNKMFKRYGGLITEFNSIWNDEDTSFRLIFNYDTNELIGVLDW